MKKQRGSTEVIKQIIEMGKSIGIEEMVAAEKVAASAGGRLVSVSSSDSDERCGTGHFRFPLPLPKPNGIIEFLELLVELRVNIEILINGIPAPDEVIFEVSRLAR